MKKPNPKDQKYFAGHIFLDQSFMNDVETYVALIEQEKKELIKDNKYVHEALNDRRKICDKLESQNKELIGYVKFESEIKKQIQDRISFLNEIKDRNKKKLKDKNDVMIEIWKIDKITIQAKLEECRLSLSLLFNPGDPINLEKLLK